MIGLLLQYRFPVLVGLAAAIAGLAYIAGRFHGAAAVSRAAQRAVIEKQDDQIKAEIDLTKRTERLQEDIRRDEGSDLDIIRRAIKRLHDG